MANPSIVGCHRVVHKSDVQSGNVMWRRSRELGLDMHLVKPVKRGELQEMLESFEPRLQGRRPPRSSRDPAANDSAA